MPVISGPADLGQIAASLDPQPLALPLHLHAPVTIDALRARLVGRGTDSSDQVDERLATAVRELAAQPEFDRVVVNDRLEEATDELVAIVQRALAAGCAQQTANLVAPDETD